VELKTYWSIIWRRIWLVALVVGVVALYVGYQYNHLRKTPGALTAYRSDITIQVGLQATPDSVDPSNADNVVISEALADALVTGPILTSKEFDTQVSHQIDADMNLVMQRYGPHPDLGGCQNTDAIGAALTAVRTHSLVTLSATCATAQGAWALANAAGEVLTTNTGTYLDYVVAKNAPRPSTGKTSQPAVTARIISNATEAVTVPGTSTNKQTLLAILLLVALVIGIALTFLADYLDDRIYTKDDAHYVLQLPVYGEVPRAPALGRGASKTRPPAV
jgi:hypothetical protein